MRASRPSLTFLEPNIDIAPEVLDDWKGDPFLLGPGPFFRGFCQLVFGRVYLIENLHILIHNKLLVLVLIASGGFFRLPCFLSDSRRKTFWPCRWCLIPDGPLNPGAGTACARRKNMHCAWQESFFFATPNCSGQQDIANPKIPDIFIGKSTFF